MNILRLLISNTSEMPIEDDIKTYLVTRNMKFTGIKRIGDRSRIYVDYSCSCGSTGHTLWDSLKKGAACIACKQDRIKATSIVKYGCENPMQNAAISSKLVARITDADISKHLDEKGMTFVRSERAGDKKGLYVVYTCACGETGKTLWYDLKQGAACPACETTRRKQTNLAKYGAESAMQNAAISNKLRVAKITDAEINSFATSAGCSNVAISRPLHSSGNRMTPVIYVDFTCVCGDTAGKKWKEFKKAPKCGKCMLRENPPNRSDTFNPRVSDNKIKEVLNQRGLQFIGVERVKIKNKDRIFVDYVCKCGNNVHQVWDVVKNGGVCSDCGNKQRGATNKITRAADPSINLRIRQTTMERYGVEYAMQNSNIFAKQKANAYSRKVFIMPSGATIICQGYEPRAMQKLLDDGVPESSIYTDLELRDGEFWYEFEGNMHRYYPDIYIACQEKYIEVKSEWTWSINEAKNKAKMACVVDAGFAIECWIWDIKDDSLRILTF